MKYFLDTEFIEDGKTIDLISIGIVAEDGRELYLQNAQCNFDKANEWVKENVIPKLDALLWRHELHRPWKIPGFMRLEILEFCDPEKYGKPEFWGYYADYDWVVLCQLFGRMIDLPKGWPMYCRDIKQFCDELGNPKLPEEGKNEHHALADARWNKAAYEFLQRKLFGDMVR